MKKLLIIGLLLSNWILACPDSKMHNTVEDLIKQKLAKKTKTKIEVNVQTVLKSCLYEKKFDLESAKAKTSILLDYCVSYGKNHNLIYEDELRIGKFIDGKYIVDYK